MERTKLTSLEKNLSDWQKQQKVKGYQNAQFFIQPPNIVDPWEIKRNEQKMAQKFIPGLQNFNYGFANSKKEMNQVLNNKRTEASRKMFEQFK